MTSKEPPPITGHLDGRCGCRAQGGRWIHLCPQAQREYDERHTQAAVDHRREQLAKDPPPK